MLALIAGQGLLPVLLARQMSENETDFRVFEMAGFSFENPDGLPVTRFRIEHLGSLLDQLVADGVKSVCFAGAIRRPIIEPAQIDGLTLPLISQIKGAIAAGDDTALRAIISLFTDRGLAITAAQDIMPVLLPQVGVLSKAKPTDQHLQEALLGWDNLAKQGAADVGQACVISKGRVIVSEQQTGTDAMLDACPNMPGGILFKGPKPGQDRRVDLPTIGIGTIDRVIKAGLDGIMIEGNGVLVLELTRVVDACDTVGLFLAVQGRP